MINQCEKVVVQCKAPLEEMVKKNAVDFRVLTENLTLLSNTEMTLDVLKSTKIGLTVNNLRKTFKNSSEVAKKTAELIRKWKKVAKQQRTISESSSTGGGDLSHGSLLNNSGTSGGSPSSEDSGLSSTSSKQDKEKGDDYEGSEEKPGKIRGPSYSSSVGSSEDMEDQEDGDGSEEKTEEMIISSRKRKSDTTETEDTPPSPKKAALAADTDDPVRLKSIEIIEEALKTDQNYMDFVNEIPGLAVGIEKAIFLQGKETDRKYKAKIRSRVSNLRDARNPELRARVLIGMISPEKLAGMTSEEMASQKLREYRKSINEESIKEHEMHEEEGTHSDMFFCRKCNSRDTNYTVSQEQRSGDFEPVAVTLVVCNKCGNRWKSS